MSAPEPRGPPSQPVVLKETSDIKQAEKQPTVIPIKDTTSANPAANLPKQSRRKASKKRRSFIPRLFLFLLRLFVYYVIYLSAWKCPPNSELTADSPRLCSPIHNLFHFAHPYVEHIHNHPIITQHISPYFSPYVEKARPYTDKAVQVANRASNAAVTFSNQAHSAVHPIVAPYLVKSSEFYNSHVSSVIDENTEKAYLFWNTNVQPQLDSLNSVVASTWEKVSPHYDTAVTKTSPYLAAAHKHSSKYASQGYDYTKSNLVDPGYESAKKGSIAAYAYSRDNIYPLAVKHSSTGWNFISEKIKYVWLLVIEHTSPKIRTLYHNKVEPQIVKVIDRIFQNGSTAEVSEPTVSASDTITTATTESESESVSSNTVSISASTVATENTYTASPSTPATETVVSETIVAETVADEVKDDKPVVAASPSIKKQANKTPKPSKSPVDFDRWKRVVGFTTTEAIEHFLKDLGAEKEALIIKGKPQFTRLLQSLQHQQQTAYAELVKLVGDIEAEVKKYSNDKERAKLPEDYEFPYSLTEVQALFKDHANKIRKETSAVREYSATFAGQILNATEKVRSNTIETLDEFAEVTFQEIGRKLVAEEHPSASDDLETKNAEEIEDEFAPAGSNRAQPSKAGWNDWKEYRKLKDRLVQSRQEIINYDIPMKDINEMLKTAQDTANILAKEAAQFLSKLKETTDHLFMLKLNTDKELREAGKKVSNSIKNPEDDDDVIFYEELEDEEKPAVRQHQGGQTVFKAEKKPVQDTKSKTVKVPTEQIKAKGAIIEEPVSRKATEPETYIAEDSIPELGEIIPDDDLEEDDEDESEKGDYEPAVKSSKVTSTTTSKNLASSATSVIKKAAEATARAAVVGDIVDQKSKQRSSVSKDVEETAVPSSIKTPKVIIENSSNEVSKETSGTEEIEDDSTLGEEDVQEALKTGEPEDDVEPTVKTVQAAKSKSSNVEPQDSSDAVIDDAEPAETIHTAYHTENVDDEEDEDEDDEEYEDEDEDEDEDYEDSEDYSLTATRTRTIIVSQTETKTATTATRVVSQGEEAEKVVEDDKEENELEEDEDNDEDEDDEEEEEEDE